MITLDQSNQIAEAREGVWNVQDDLCDCVYQRVNTWWNPYIGEFLETRLCCVWAKFEEMWPELFRRTKSEPAMWNGEADMPPAIWHRQMANHLGVPLAEARTLAGPAPKGRPKAPPLQLWLRDGGEWALMETDG